MFAETIQFAWD